jgi:hypothetical protein
MRDRYHRYRQRKIRKESRTLPMPGHVDYGDGKDSGKYYRCWHCGVVCDIDREELGDGESKDGVSYTVYDAALSSDSQDSSENITPIHQGANEDGVNDDVYALSTMLTVRTGHVIMENDAAGDPKTVRVNYTPDVSSGCWFCGTLNWKGDY